MCPRSSIICIYNNGQSLRFSPLHHSFSLVHSVSKYLLSNYFVLSMVLDDGERLGLLDAPVSALLDLVV